MHRRLISGFATLLIVGLMGVGPSQATDNQHGTPKLQYLVAPKLWSIGPLYQFNPTQIVTLQELLIANGFLPLGDPLNGVGNVAIFKKELSTIAIILDTEGTMHIQATGGDGLKAINDLARLYHVPVH